MKNLTTPIVLILILFLFGCESEKLGPQSAPVGPTQQQLIDLRNQGDETGNGGDNITVHFKAEAQQVITILEHFKDKIGVDVDLLKGLFKEGTKRGIVVVSTEQKLYDKFAVLNYDAAGTLESVSGEEKDALNFPNGKSESAY